MALALSQDKYSFLSILAVSIILFVVKTLPFYSIYFILPLFSIAVIRSIFVSKIAIQQITEIGDEVEIIYLRFNKSDTLKIEKFKLTFRDINSYRDTLDRIQFMVNSNKEFTQYFVGQFNTAEFDSLKSKLSEIGIRKPYGYNL